MRVPARHHGGPGCQTICRRSLARYYVEYHEKVEIDLLRAELPVLQPGWVFGLRIRRGESYRLWQHAPKINDKWFQPTTHRFRVAASCERVTAGWTHTA